jgi:hypothetical protein
MTTDSTQPQTEVGPAPVNGPGQSQGHRRRRRRRKNKGSQGPAAQTQQGQQPQAQSPAPAQAQAPPPQQPRAQHGQGGQGGGTGGGQGRKKKKFFQKASTPRPELGNSISYSPGNGSGGGGGKRKMRQKGPREFVGPMDHSYRELNGNVADGPPSTIQISSSNGHNGYYQQDPYFAPFVSPVREDAPTKILCFIDDLFFQAKINETSKKLGVKVEFLKGDKDSVARITDAPEEQWPTLVVFDLNNLNAKPMTLIPKFKAKFKKATSIVGFLNHLQGDLKAKAVEAGCDTVMPRSAFSQSLPNLLRRYGMEEEEDNYPQPV